MSSGWQTKKLSDVCQIKPPKKEAKELLSESDLVSFVPMNDLRIRHKAFNHKEEKPLGKVVGSYTYFAENDVLLAKITPCFENGKLGIARGLKNGIGFGSSEYIVFRSKGEIDPEYLFYFLSQDSFRDAGSRVMTGAVGHKRVPKEFIEDHPIPLPSLDKQKRIAAILDEAFAGIDTAIANTEKNLANARELFESYLNSVFTKQGDGWTEKTVGEMADCCLGKMLDKQKNRGLLRPYLRNLNVQWFNIDTSDVQEMKIEVKEEERYGVLKGDLLICEGGYPGRAAVWEYEGQMFFQKALHRVRFIEPLYNRWFLYFLYLSDANGSLSQHFTGAGIQHFTGKALKQFRFPVAPLSCVKSFLDKIDGIHIETQRLEALYQQKLTVLNELKQSLLQKAFSGELTAEADNLKEEAVA
ncbi:MAG: restriction endonuclease subunit S [Candidatus Thiodiazotropha sp. (ex Semelilucina semeliformis)]|nr:restriction endonuclease subunit S [Candidatus Thiodiazotropha sp. (ex Semelilucina semeliformis)]